MEDDARKFFGVAASDSVPQGDGTHLVEVKMNDGCEYLKSDLCTELQAEIENLKIGSGLSRDAILRLEKQVEKLKADRAALAAALRKAKQCCPHPHELDAVLAQHGGQQ